MGIVKHRISCHKCGEIHETVVVKGTKMEFEIIPIKCNCGELLDDLKHNYNIHGLNQCPRCLTGRYGWHDEEHNDDFWECGNCNYPYTK